MEEIDVQVGQRWRERDTRANRVVEIVEIAISGPRRIKIRTIKSDNPNAVGRATWASHERFAGKPGGYERVAG